MKELKRRLRAFRYKHSKKLRAKQHETFVREMRGCFRVEPLKYIQDQPN